MTPQDHMTTAPTPHSTIHKELALWSALEKVNAKNFEEHKNQIKLTLKHLFSEKTQPYSETKEMFKNSKKLPREFGFRES